MKSSDFYSKFNSEISNLDLDNLKKVINNIIRKVPKNKYEEVLDIFNKNIDGYSDKEIISEIEKYEKKFQMIDEFKLYFHATGYEDYGEYYNPWGGDWIWEYTDEDKIGDIIYDAVMYAVDLVNHKKYKYAKTLLDLILYTNYQVLDDDGDDAFEISLIEMHENGLTNINVYTLCLYIIYTTYQVSNVHNRAQNIYKYFSSEEFRNVSVEDSFNLGVEILENTNDFWNDWILLLGNNAGNIEYRLLKEAMEYTNYKNYKYYVEQVYLKHPKIYIDIFDYLYKINNIDEIIKLGNKALNKLDKNLKIRNDIALYLAQYDENNKEKYIFESFLSNTNIPNLLRIINNGYYKKYNKEIEKITSNYNRNSITYKNFELEQNLIDINKYCYLQFFMGNFEGFFDECLKHNATLGWSGSFIQTAVYLWLLILNEKDVMSPAYLSIISSTFNNLDFSKNDLLFLEDDYHKIFKNWKKQFNIDITQKEKYINWLIRIIDKRVEAIVGGSKRKSYYKAAILVVALGEVLETNNIQSKEAFVNKYHKQYVRRSAFRKELKKYYSNEEVK